VAFGLGEVPLLTAHPQLKRQAQVRGARTPSATRQDAHSVWSGYWVFSVMVPIGA